MAMSEKERKQVMGLLIAVPLGLLVFYWMNLRADNQAEIAALEVTVDSMETAIQTARRDLASGSVEALRQRVGELEASVSGMRQLVPTDAEVANLLDDISNRSRMRNVTLGDFSRSTTPADDLGGTQFQSARYQFQVFGAYHNIGAFLADIASLPRIMVPENLSLAPLNPRDAAALGDTTGTMLQANFLLRTFVKPAGEMEASGETP